MKRYYECMKNALPMENIEKIPTLADISPKWYSRLFEHDLPKLFSATWLKWYFELKFASKCVVGEAHGYNPSYLIQCSECDNYGWKFMIYFTLRSRSRLDENKKKFVEHWVREHSVVFRQIREIYN
jgi:hypothetical protein